LSSALSSLLGEEGVVSLSTHTLPLPGLLLAAEDGREPTLRPETGRELAMPVPGLLPTAALGGRLPAGAVGGLPAVGGLLPPVAGREGAAASLSSSIAGFC